MTGSSLVGVWETDPDDERSLREYGRVTLNFKPEGVLEYTIHTDGKRQIMLLTYRVDGGTLVTDQPSAPRLERTPCALMPDGRLRLGEGHLSTTYVRSERPPDQRHIH